MIKAFLSLFLSLSPLCAQTYPGEIALKASGDAVKKFSKSDLEIYIPVTGVSAAYEEEDILAPFDGRVEEVIGEQFDFVEKKELLASMVSTEMAAMIDASSGLSRRQMEKRWKGVFDYYRVKAPFRGVITNVYAEPKQKVLKGERLFTIARKVMIVAKNTKPIFSSLSEGLPAEMRYSRDKRIKFATKLMKFMPLAPNSFYYRLWLDIEKLSDDIIVGARFNGFLFVGRVEDAVIVPKSDIIHLGDRKFMMIEVKTGLVSQDKAEITGTEKYYISPEITGMKK